MIKQTNKQKKFPAPNWLKSVGEVAFVYAYASWF